MSYQLTIKKVHVFNNEKDGKSFTTYALASKDHTDIPITGNWIYLKDNPENLAKLNTGMTIKGELNNKTFTIQHDAQPPAGEYNYPPNYMPENNGVPQQNYVASTNSVPPSNAKAQAIKMINKLQVELEELRLLMIEV